MTLQSSGTLTIGSSELEYRMIGPMPDKAPTIVMLHEGLGSVGLWGDFPEKLQAATGAGVFVYSRAGYGNSSPVKLPRPLNFMDIEALDVLPKVLDAIGFRRGLLLGHSDGASIATIYAGGVQDHRVRGLMLIAPHFVVEDFGLDSIAKTKQNYEAAISNRGSRAGTRMSTTPSAAGTTSGSIRNSATGIFPMRWLMCACPSKSSRVPAISTARCAISRSRRPNAIARSRPRSFLAQGIRPTGKPRTSP